MGGVEDRWLVDRIGGWWSALVGGGADWWVVERIGGLWSGLVGCGLVGG